MIEELFGFIQADLLVSARFFLVACRSVVVIVNGAMQERLLILYLWPVCWSLCSKERNISDSEYASEYELKTHK